jgi:ATP synthase, H+ transporting, mitochondrial F0 complex, subunit s
MLFRQISKTMPLVTSQRMSKGNFWGWVNMMFNRVDRSRLQKVGAERLCTEWLLKNGAAVRFTSNPSLIHADYNSLPSDKLPFPFKIKEVIGEFLKVLKR